MPEFAKGMASIKEMKRDKTKVVYTAVKHPLPNITKFLSSLGKVFIKLGQNIIDDQMNIKLALIRS